MLPREVEKLINDYADNQEQLFGFLCYYNNDLALYGFVDKIKKYVLNDDVKSLEMHLKTLVPMHVNSSQSGCLMDAKKTCEYMMIYAAYYGKREIVEVLASASLIPVVSIYQNIEPDFIKHAMEMLEPNTLSLGR